MQIQLFKCSTTPHTHTHAPLSSTLQNEMTLQSFQVGMRTLLGPNGIFHKTNVSFRSTKPGVSAQTPPPCICRPGLARAVYVYGKEPVSTNPGCQAGAGCSDLANQWARCQIQRSACLPSAAADRQAIRGASGGRSKRPGPESDGGPEYQLQPAQPPPKCHPSRGRPSPRPYWGGRRGTSVGCGRAGVIIYTLNCFLKTWAVTHRPGRN